MKLALGTVQFGLPYGVANRAGQIAMGEATAILVCAREHGIDTLDTAIAYGDSEERLGAIGVGDWRIISKLPQVPLQTEDVGNWVASCARASLERLQVPNLYGLLLHRPAQLLEPSGDDLFEALRRLKDEGLVRKVGVSVYDPSELASLVNRFPIDLVQAPLNVFDRRLVDSGWLARLSSGGIEVHTRSVFLQGLLLMAPSERPAAFDRWPALWAAYDRWIATNPLTRLEACVRYAVSVPGVSKVIVGVDCMRHLKEIVAAAVGPAPAAPPGLASDDVDLVNPARWPVLA